MTVGKRELDAHLQPFFVELKKQDGGDYEPESLRTMIAALDRHVRELGCDYSILKDKEFTECRKVLNGKAIDLREKGKGKRKRKADAVCDEEEKSLWDRGILGDENLNHAIFYTLSQHFGTRGRQEHHQLRLEDLKFVKNAITGEIEHVEWVEGLTKTRRGGLVKNKRRVPQKAYKTGERSCPVHLLEKLISKRPESLKLSGLLYLTPLTKYTGRDIWYTIVPVGVNTINTFMKSKQKEGGLDSTGKRLTNHSVRKTMVKKLQKQGVPNNKIAAITGHKKEQSLQYYAEMDESDHAEISKVLCGYKDPKRHELDANTSIVNKGHHYPAMTPSIAPMYTFNNYNFFFRNTPASTSSNQYELPPVPKHSTNIVETDVDLLTLFSSYYYF